MNRKKLTLILSLILLIQSNLFAQADKSKAPKEDGYEMKQYFFVMLTKGLNRNHDSVTAAKIQEGHIANINRLAQMGKIVVAGPFGGKSDWLGIFIFDSPNKEEVEQLLKTDPAVAAGRLGYQIQPWWTAKNCVFK